MIIRVRDLVKVYRMGETEVRALDGVSLEIGRNEFVAVMGASGSGKSTLMNILGCLDRPTSGTYELNARRTDGLGAGALARIRNEEIGFVFQSFELLPRATALENVMLPLVYSRRFWFGARRRARAALERVGLGSRTDHRPSQLSGGQRQRVAIARALVNGPDLLLADEPTGALDSRTGLEIMALFQELHRAGVAVLMVTHDPEVAAFAERVLRFRDGRLVSDTRQVPRDAAEALAALPAAEEAA